MRTHLDRHPKSRIWRSIKKNPRPEPGDERKSVGTITIARSFMPHKSWGIFMPITPRPLHLTDQQLDAVHRAATPLGRLPENGCRISEGRSRAGRRHYRASCGYSAGAFPKADGDPGNEVGKYARRS